MTCHAVFTLIPTQSANRAAACGIFLINARLPCLPTRIQRESDSGGAYPEA